MMSEHTLVTYIMHMSDVEQGLGVHPDFYEWKVQQFKVTFDQLVALDHMTWPH